jgi:haloacetate dehalogenase
MVAIMTRLGFERFSIAGHDRGGRVAYLAALDAPERAERLAVLDVVPIDTAWERADARLALGFWPWSLLALPQPLPERLVGAAPEAVIDHVLSEQWGTPADTFDEKTRSEYLAQMRDTDHVHAICEEYRAAASIDREHARADRTAGRRIAYPVLVLWSGTGPLAAWHTDAGGPLALWRETGPQRHRPARRRRPLFPEEHQRDTAQTLAAFISPDGD